MSGIYGERPENGAVSGANDMENPFLINHLAGTEQEAICEPHPTGRPAERAGTSARRRHREPAPGRPWRQAPAGSFTGVPGRFRQASVGRLGGAWRA